MKSYNKLVISNMDLGGTTDSEGKYAAFEVSFFNHKLKIKLILDTEFSTV